MIVYSITVSIGKATYRAGEEPSEVKAEHRVRDILRDGLYVPQPDVQLCDIFPPHRITRVRVSRLERP